MNIFVKINLQSPVAAESLPRPPSALHPTAVSAAIKVTRRILNFIISLCDLVYRNERPMRLQNNYKKTAASSKLLQAAVRFSPKIV